MPAKNVHCSRSLKSPPGNFKNGHDPPKAQKELFSSVGSCRAFFIFYSLSRDRFPCLTTKSF